MKKTMASIRRYLRPRVYYRVIRGTTKWIGMAKLEPFTDLYPKVIFEPGDVWFAIAPTRGEAYWKITDEMIELGLERDVIFCPGK